MRSMRIEPTTGQSILMAGCLALAGCLYEGYAAWESIGAREWPGIIGKITRSEVQENPFGKSLVFRYQYKYEGTQYSGSRLNCGGLGQCLPMFNLAAPKILERYPKGKDVTVYVNPKNPAASVLVAEFPRSAQIAFGISIAVLISACGLPFALTNGRNERKDQSDAANPQPAAAGDSTVADPATAGTPVAAAPAPNHPSTAAQSLQQVANPPPTKAAGGPATLAQTRLPQSPRPAANAPAPSPAHPNPPQGRPAPVAQPARAATPSAGRPQPAASQIPARPMPPAQPASATNVPVAGPSKSRPAASPAQVPQAQPSPARPAGPQPPQPGRPSRKAAHPSPGAQAVAAKPVQRTGNEPSSAVAGKNSAVIPPTAAPAEPLPTTADPAPADPLSIALPSPVVTQVWV